MPEHSEPYAPDPDKRSNLMKEIYGEHKANIERENRFQKEREIVLQAIEAINTLWAIDDTIIVQDHREALNKIYQDLNLRLEAGHWRSSDVAQAAAKEKTADDLYWAEKSKNEHLDEYIEAAKQDAEKAGVEVKLREPEAPESGDSGK